MAHLTIGERFKDARLIYNQHGKQSMKEVEQATGVSASMIKDLEADAKRSVGYDKIVALAKHYNVSINWLLELSNDYRLTPCTTDELGITARSENTILEQRNMRTSVYYTAFLNDMIEFGTECNVLNRYMEMTAGTVRSKKPMQKLSPNSVDEYMAFTESLMEMGYRILKPEQAMTFLVAEFTESIKRAIIQKYGKSTNL